MTSFNTSTCSGTGGITLHLHIVDPAHAQSVDIFGFCSLRRLSRIQDALFVGKVVPVAVLFRLPFGAIHGERFRVLGADNDPVFVGRFAIFGIGAEGGYIGFLS